MVNAPVPTTLGASSCFTHIGNTFNEIVIFSSASGLLGPILGHNSANIAHWTTFEVSIVLQSFYIPECLVECEARLCGI
ncbi:hypothetical protein TNCT_353781 [Trichonephila clavata]|uniref:Uncharacterized protein n=1 Tax=Trichonephila clavata TaxID=2740835 RepID=A0A8X6GGI0_TRICU|nr:hypothetical protein TNCT_353781 [Trichonephila clavata]